MDFLKRWRAMSGGWAVVFTAPPPPPYPESKAVFGAKSCDCDACDCGQCKCGDKTAQVCICGDNCTCKKGDCPKKCPVSFGQCPGGKCPSVVPSNPFDTGLKLLPEKRLNPQVPIGSPPTADHYWGSWEDGTWGWRLKGATPPVENPKPKVEPESEPVADPKITNYGVDTSKLHGTKKYTLSGGVEIHENQAKSILVGDGKIKDDSDHWHLTVVGDDTFLKSVKGTIDGLPTATKSHLHVQYYNPSDWPVAKYSLPLGVSLRKPSPGRVAEQVGTLSVSDFNPDKLLNLLQWLNGKPPTPITPPSPPTPSPVPPVVPDPLPFPIPSPLPSPSSPLNIPLIVVILGVLYFLLTRK